MMKVNTKNTVSLFEKGFAKYPFNSQKKKIDVRYKKLLRFWDFVSPWALILCSDM